MSEEWAKLQIQKFEFGFDEADKDKSGSLSFTEVKNILVANGFKGTPKDTMAIFGRLDKDGDRALSRSEFSQAMKALPRMSIKEYVFRKAFKQIDKNGNGFLSVAEVKDAINNDGGIKISDQKVSEMLAYIKTDADGKIRYDEFLEMMGVEDTATVLYRIFSSIDTDGSGFLSREEIVAGVKADDELKLSADNLNDLLAAWHKDEDGKISYKEFVDAWLKEQKKK